MNDTGALVADYLRRLEKELSDLPRPRRRELVEEISEHINEARTGLESQSEAEIRTLLDRLGDPADIAAEARERFGIQPKKSGAVEVGALILLPIGGVIVPILGWVVGVILLWISEVWSKREKLIGTFLVPGGLALPVYLIGFFSLDAGESCVSNRGPGARIRETCSGGASSLESILLVLILILLVVTPLVTTAYLARRMRRRSKSDARWTTPSTVS